LLGVSLEGALQGGLWVSPERLSFNCAHNIKLSMEDNLDLTVEISNQTSRISFRKGG